MTKFANKPRKKTDCSERFVALSNRKQVLVLIKKEHMDGSAVQLPVVEGYKDILCSRAHLPAVFSPH